MHLPKHVYGLLLGYKKKTFIDENNGRSLCLIARDVTKSLAGEMVNSPGPAPEPELLPSDLSSDWPTGREGGRDGENKYIGI